MVSLASPPAARAVSKIKGSISTGSAEDEPVKLTPSRRHALYSRSVSALSIEELIQQTFHTRGARRIDSLQPGYLAADELQLGRRGLQGNDIFDILRSSRESLHGQYILPMQYGNLQFTLHG